MEYCGWGFCEIVVEVEAPAMMILQVGQPQAKRHLSICPC
jgi:hypothetical protein